MSRLEDQINAILKRAERRPPPAPDPALPLEERIRDFLVKRLRSLEWFGCTLAGGKLASTGEIIYIASIFGEEESRGGISDARPYVQYAIVEQAPSGEFVLIFAQPVQDVQPWPRPKLLPVVETQLVEPEALSVAHLAQCNEEIIPALYEIYSHFQREQIGKKKKSRWLQALAHATKHLRVTFDEKIADRRDRCN